MNGYDAPSPLDAELLEECGGHYPFVGDEAVRVEEEATDNGYEDDGEAAPKYLGGWN